MGHKVHPYGFRLGVSRTWTAKWYADNKEYTASLQEDIKIRQHIQGIVMAADNDDGVFDGRKGPKQLGQNRLIFLDPFHVIGNADDAVRLGQGGDASSAPGKRNGDNPLIDFSQLDADKFFHSQL